MNVQQLANQMAYCFQWNNPFAGEQKNFDSKTCLVLGHVQHVSRASGDANMPICAPAPPPAHHHHHHHHLLCQLRIFQYKAVSTVSPQAVGIAQGMTRCPRIARCLALTTRGAMGAHWAGDPQMGTEPILEETACLFHATWSDQCINTRILYIYIIIYTDR